MAEATGMVVHVGETTEVTATFKKRSLILEIAENPNYPEQVKFEAVQDKCALLDELRQGDVVTVHFNLRGRAWTSKTTGVMDWINTLAIWKFTVNKTAPAASQGHSAPDDDEPPF